MSETWKRNETSLGRLFERLCPAETRDVDGSSVRVAATAGPGAIETIALAVLVSAQAIVLVSTMLGSVWWGLVWWWIGLLALSAGVAWIVGRGRRLNGMIVVGVMCCLGMFYGGWNWVFVGVWAMNLVAMVWLWVWRFWEEGGEE